MKIKFDPQTEKLVYCIPAGEEPEIDDFVHALATFVGQQAKEFNSLRKQLIELVEERNKLATTNIKTWEPHAVIDTYRYEDEDKEVSS